MLHNTENPTHVSTLISSFPVDSSVSVETCDQTLPKWQRSCPIWDCEKWCWGCESYISPVVAAGVHPAYLSLHTHHQPLLGHQDHQSPGYRSRHQTNICRVKRRAEESRGGVVGGDECEDHALGRPVEGRVRENTTRIYKIIKIDLKQRIVLSTELNSICQMMVRTRH